MGLLASRALALILTSHKRERIEHIKVDRSRHCDSAGRATLRVFSVAIVIVVIRVDLRGTRLDRNDSSAGAVGDRGQYPIR